jgi:hypothetical protein
MAPDGAGCGTQTFVLATFAGRELGVFDVTPDGRILAAPSIQTDLEAIARSQGWRGSDIVNGFTAGWENAYLSITPAQRA